MRKAQTYRDLESWQSGMQLVEDVYRNTRHFPDDEKFGLTSQLRRAAVSIPSNVAEGACRRTTPTFINHVDIALGSHGEVETCIEVAFRLGYLSKSAKDDLNVLCGSTGRLLNGLLRSLEARVQQQKRNT